MPPTLASSLASSFSLLEEFICLWSLQEQLYMSSTENCPRKRSEIGFLSSCILLVRDICGLEKKICQVFSSLPDYYKVSPMAYKWKLPEGWKKHPLFHVSLLKKKIGEGIVVQPKLPTTCEKGTLMPIGNSTRCVGKKDS